MPPGELGGPGGRLGRRARPLGGPVRRSAGGSQRTERVHRRPAVVARDAAVLKFVRRLTPRDGLAAYLTHQLRHRRRVGRSARRRSGPRARDLGPTRWATYAAAVKRIPFLARRYGCIADVTAPDSVFKSHFDLPTSQALRIPHSALSYGTRSGSSDCFRRKYSYAFCRSPFETRSTISAMPSAAISRPPSCTQNPLTGIRRPAS